MLKKTVVVPVIQHIGGNDQIQFTGDGEVIVGQGQGQLVELGIQGAGQACRFIQVAGDTEPGAGSTAGQCNDARATTEVQYPFATHLLGVIQYPACQCQTTAPAESPVRRLLQQAPGFLAGKGAVEVGRVQQPQLQFRKVGQGGGLQAGIGQNPVQCVMQLVERHADCLLCPRGLYCSLCWLQGAASILRPLAGYECWHLTAAGIGVRWPSLFQQEFSRVLSILQCQ